MISIQLKNKALTFIKAIIASIAFSASQGFALPLDGFTTICTLDENCAVEDSTLVAFGTESQYTYKTVSGNFICAAATFDLPKPASANATCSVMNSALATGSSSTSSSGIAGNNSDGSDNSQNAALKSGQYAIISISSGKALSIKDSDLDDGALLVQQDFNQQVNQLWNVEDLGDGYYSITALHSQKALESQNWNIRDGAHLQQFTWINSWNQHWSITPVDDDSFRINARANGHAIDLFEMNRKDNGEVCLWTYWGGSNQHWQFIEIADETE